VPAKQEDEMKFTNFAAATLAVGLVLGSAAAYATDDDSSISSCTRSRIAATDAIKANSTSPNVEAARQEARAASNYCNLGLYSVGTARYRKALSLLNAG
jgi:hypothetical protein